MAKNGFVFNTPAGKVVGEAKSLEEFRELVKKVPMESLRFHLGRKDFIKWLMYMKQPGLAARVRKIKTDSWDFRGDLAYALTVPKPKKPVKRKPAKKKKVVEKKLVKKK